MALSFGIDDYIEGSVITAVILLNIIVGYITSTHLLSLNLQENVNTLGLTSC